MAGFWIYFLIQVVIAIAMIELTAKKPKSNLKAQGLDQLDFPTVDASRSIPYFAGDVMLDAPNLTWYGDYRAVTIKKSVKISLFQSSHIDIAIKYYIGMELSLAFGVVDYLKEIWFGEKLAWSGSVTDGGTAQVDNMGLFGGEGQGGGVQASVVFLAGRPDQAADAYMTAVQGKAYNQKGICRLIWKGPAAFFSTGAPVPSHAALVTLLGSQQAHLVSLLTTSTGRASGVSSGCVGENPIPPPLKARCWRWPNNLALGSGRHIINNTANPAEVIYELMTGRYLPFFGEIASPHLTDDEIDIAALRTLGITCFNEGLGISFQWQQDGSIGAIVDDVLDQIGGIKREDPRNGLISFKLLRKDYTIGDLPVLDETSISKLENFGRQAISATTNKLVATYTDKNDQFKTKPVMVQSNASMWMTGNESPTNIDLTYLTDVDVVNARAQQRLQQVVFPAATGTLVTDRRAWRLVAGDCFVLNWAPKNITNLVCRMSGVNRGNVANNVIEVMFIEDIFSIGTAIFSAPPASGWVDPRNAADAVTLYQAEESPYQTAIGLPPYRMLLWALPPSSDAFSVNVFTSVSGGPYTEAYDREPFSMPVPLLADWGFGDELDVSGTLHLDLTGVLDKLVKAAPLIDIQNNHTNWINLKGEWIAVVDWTDLGGGDFQITSVYRGLLDTRPRAHPSAEIGYLVEDMIDVRNTQFALGAAWGLKLQTLTGIDILDIASAPAITGTIRGRTDLPFAPGHLLINGTAYPSTVSGSLLLSWSHRHRPLQATVLTDETIDYGPAAGTTYTVRLFDDSTDTLLNTITGVTGTSCLASSGFTGALRVEVVGVLAGSESWQPLQATFGYTAPLPGVRIVDDLTSRITADGDLRVTE